MLLSYLFWMFMGFINRRPNPNCCFLAYFSVSKKRNIKRSPNGMKPSGEVIFGKKAIQETWSARQGINEESTRQGGAPTPWARPPPSWAPRGSPDVFLPPIYIHIP